MSTRPVTLVEALRGRKLLIFDFDGTIADTSPMHEAAFIEVLQPLGLEVRYSEIAGMRTREAILKCLHGEGLLLPENEVAELVRRKQEAARSRIAESVEPLPGVDRFLRWAKDRFKLAMVTSGSKAAVSMALEKLGYSGWFTPCITGDDVEQGKPHPEGFLKVIDQTGIAPHEALVFEDSHSGFTAARKAGLTSWDVNISDWSVPPNHVLRDS